MHNPLDLYQNALRFAIQALGKSNQANRGWPQMNRAINESIGYESHPLDPVPFPCTGTELLSHRLCRCSVERLTPKFTFHY